MRWLLWCKVDGTWNYMGDWHLNDSSLVDVMVACTLAGWATQLALAH